MLTSGITLRWMLRKYCIRTVVNSPRSSRIKTLVPVNMGNEALVLQKDGDCNFELPREESLKLKLFFFRSFNRSSVRQIKEVRPKFQQAAPLRGLRLVRTYERQIFAVVVLVLSGQNRGIQCSCLDYRQCN